MPVQITSQRLGDPQKPLLIVAHGLCGSGKNWLSLAQRLTQNYCVDLIDLRNHGQSPWTPTMSYAELCEDFLAYWQKIGCPAFTFLGHSLGGKLGMVLATQYTYILQQALHALIVVDIAPKTYHPQYMGALQACLQLELSDLHSEQEADERLAQAIPQSNFRSFLLSNLIQTPDNHWRWSCHYQACLDNLKNLATNPLSPNDISHIQTLFIAGTRSEFITADDTPILKHHFPTNELIWLPTGHNVHMEAPAELTQEILSWKLRTSR